MGLDECLAFATAHPVCFLATDDTGQPRVRAVMLWLADRRGFTFMTMSPKSLSGQLHRNPRVEVCFYNGAAELADAKTMRLSGDVEFVDDIEQTRQVCDERAALEGVVGRPLAPIAEVFRIASGEARFWTLTDMLRESEVEMIRF